MLTQTAYWLDPDFRQPANQNQRLFVALLIAATMHALLIFSLRFDQVDVGLLELPLTIDVSLLRRDAETEAPAEVIEVPVAPTTEPAPALPRPPDQARSGSPETVAEKPVRPVVSLDEATVQAIKSMLDQQAEQRRRDAEMWAKSRSVMFEPSPQWVTGEAPVLPGLRLDGRGFKGIGFSFLGCFLGLPAIDAKDIDTDAYDPSLTNIRRSGISFINCGARD